MLVLTRADVRTQDPARPRATAVAVDGGRVVAVGDEYDLASLPLAGALVVDCEGRTVVPAFTDAHCHFGSLALARCRVALAGARSIPECLDRVRAHLEG
ncbi:MAG: amidohydrolase, partial [Planctomycetes bacterium]|nr:amidohydrolase [Planctomycetota bacterium]